ncbi:MAG: hypothetical protein MUC60_13450 [Oscillatoria sp. Prado101]|nr:hypothetical protein [Oscillatoria sp. Prado101]
MSLKCLPYWRASRCRLCRLLSGELGTALCRWHLTQIGGAFVAALAER